MRVLLAVVVGGTALLGCGGKFRAQSSSAAIVTEAGAPPVDAAIYVADSPLDPPPTPFPPDTGPVFTQCMPGLIPNFVPEWRPPPNTLTGACSDAQLAAAVSACFGVNATHDSCEVWRAIADSTPCVQCLVGPVSARVWNPILEVSGNAVDPSTEGQLVNVGGCIALADPSNIACAEAVEGAFACEMEQCIPVCTVPESSPPTATLGILGACFQEADMTNSCADYASAAAACTTNVGPSSYCFQATRDDDALTQLLGAACGQPPNDAGSD